VRVTVRDKKVNTVAWPVCANMTGGEFLSLSGALLFVLYLSMMLTEAALLAINQAVEIIDIAARMDGRTHDEIRAVCDRIEGATSAPPARATRGRRPRAIPIA
jgi:hypothetical protein